MTMPQPTPITPDQVMAQLKTRGFERGGFRSPLRHFRGKLESITGSMVQRGNMTQARLEVNYNFVDIEVFDSTEPYPFPIAQISIMHNIRDRSNMGVLGISIDKVINADINENEPQEKARNQDFLIGKVQEWRVIPGHMMWDADKGMETPRECFEVVYVEGVGGTPHSGVAATVEAPGTTPEAPAVPGTTPQPGGLTPAQQAMNLLDNKTQQEWNNTVFQDLLVKGDPELTNSIIQGTFIPPLEASGLITKDADGRFHLKKD